MQLIKKFDSWLYKNKIKVLFNIFSSTICIIFVLISGLGKFDSTNEKIIRIPDGVIYQPKFNTKNPWVSFSVNGKNYSTSCMDFDYEICKNFHNQELIGFDVLFLLPDSSAETSSGLILDGKFTANSHVSFSIHNKKDEYLKKEKFFRYVALVFRYFSYVYFIVVCLLTLKLFNV